MRSDDILMVDGAMIDRLQSRLSAEARYLLNFFDGQRSLEDVMRDSVMPRSRTIAGLRELARNNVLLAVRPPPKRYQVPWPEVLRKTPMERTLAVARTKSAGAAEPASAELRPATVGYRDRVGGPFRSR